MMFECQTDSRVMFSKVLCISLASRTDRRDHAADELGRQGLAPFSWVSAYDGASEAVGRAFSADRVAPFPPCFRCGAERCDCENRRLMPEQVGTWLSHEDAWRSAAEEGLTLICEDDVKFTERAAEGIAAKRDGGGLAEVRFGLARLQRFEVIAF